MEVPRRGRKGGQRQGQGPYGLTLALSQRESGILGSSMRARDSLSSLKGERGDSLALRRARDYQLPKGLGGILGSSEGEGLSASPGGGGEVRSPRSLCVRGLG